MSKSNINKATLKRRDFLKAGTGITLFIGAGGLIPALTSCSEAGAMDFPIEPLNVTAWVKLDSDGTITICNPAAEMGQGSMTSLPMIFAEEMDADWDKVKVEFSAQEPAIFGSEGWGNRKIMLTAGSRTINGYFNVLRKAGAQARYILMHSVAEKWGVPINQVDTKAGQVIHKLSNRVIYYGEIIPFLKVPDNLPEFSEKELKSPQDFRLIGKDFPRTDIPDKLNGAAQFAIDIRLPNMVYGVIERGRIHGARPTLNNETALRALPGVIDLVVLEYGVGIISTSLEQGLAAKKSLNISWSDSEASGFNSEEAYTTYEQVAAEGGQGRVVTNIGDFKSAQDQATKIYSADYKNDYVYHAQMEPLNSIVQVAADGSSAEVWVGSQQGFTPKFGVPQVLGIEPRNVKIHMQYLGGGLGRRSMTDFITECALLAKKVAPRPVKLIWTREDDLTYGAYRPMSLQRLIATTDSSGKLTGLSHTVIGDGDNLVASGIKNEFYDIPNQSAQIKTVKHGIRLKHWRAVGHGPNKFAIESLLDDIAYDQNKDPVEFRRILMQHSPRALATLEKAAEMAKWNKPTNPGRAKGVAFLERSGTLSTGICEISIDERTGKIRVHHFWTANDAGIVIHPDNVKAQLEGGIIMGMSSVLMESLTINNGAVQQSNFLDYPILRIEDIPESIETAIIKSTGHPQGVGESGTPLVAGAIANAFLKLTGKRIRHLPFTPKRVLKVLNG